MLDLSAETAVSAAGAALWTWQSADACLSIRAETGGPLAHLDGRWGLEAFTDLMETGAASASLSRLATGRLGETIDARLRLRDGRRLRLIGAFHEAGLARGLFTYALSGNHPSARDRSITVDTRGIRNGCHPP